MKGPGSAPRVGELLPHVRRHPEREKLLDEPADKLRERMGAGDMVAALVLKLTSGQRTLLRARLKA